MTILITGASHGIGAEIVKYVSGHYQCLVFALARNKEQLADLADLCNRAKNGSRVIPIAFDLDTMQFDLLIELLTRHSPVIDFVVHNAGLLINKPFVDVTPEQFDASFRINVKVPFFLTQALLPMLSKGSHVVVAGSMGGFQGSSKYPGLSVYSASKGALAVLAESMAEELSRQSVSVNALALGAVQTEMLQQAFPGYQAPVVPSQMAKFISWFLIHAHKVMNGKVVPVALSNP